MIMYIRYIIMYFFMWYFSGLEHIVKAKNQDIVKINSSKNVHTHAHTLTHTHTHTHTHTPQSVGQLQEMRFQR